MRIKINFIIPSRAAFPREKGVVLTQLRWYPGWPQVGKVLPYNHWGGGGR